MAAELTLTKDNFEAEVLKSAVPVLVDFWAAWCGPCKMVGPVVAELAQEYSGKLKVGKLNVDEHSEVAATYGIRGIPTLIIFRNGAISEQAVGFQSKDKLKQMIDRHIQADA
jgi:thioredoxin 1